MERVNPHCCGLDVHKASVSACIRVAQEAKVHQEVRTFRTDSGGLMELREWLQSQRISIAAMEATGVYWKPVYHALQDAMEVLLVNAAHVKQVAERKTAVKDCVWLAQTAGARFVAGQLHSTPADSRTARSDALAQESG